MYEMLKKPKTSNTVQCVRKRVYGRTDSVERSDLFYDRSDGKYYYNMREIGFRKDCRIYEDEYRDYLKGRSKDRSSHTVFLAELSDKTAYIKSPVLTAPGEQQVYTREAPLYSGVLVSTGIEDTAPPPIVRLYSEAEMTHASTLAETMTSAARYNAFRKIGYGDLRDAGYSGTRAPLIKATEFDDRAHVMARYSSNRQYNVGKAAKNATSAESGNLTADQESALRDIIQKAVKDAFTAGRLLAEKHSRRHGGLGNVFRDAGGAVAEALDEIFQAISEENTVEPEAAEAVIKWEISVRIKEILEEAAFSLNEEAKVSLNTKAKEAIMKQFKTGYVAVSSGWNDQERRLSEREDLSSLEVSYGGKTGDMTSPHRPHAPQRKYDLIQSTFFWMPGVSSLENGKAMLKFFVSQNQKLEPGGIIRLVSFSNNEGMDEAKEGWEEKKNQYGKAAEWVYAQLKRSAYYTDVRKTLLVENNRREGAVQKEGKPYSKELSERGLNPMRDNRPQYRPLWTDTNKTVHAGGEGNGNLILQARKRRTFRF